MTFSVTPSISSSSLQLNRNRSRDLGRDRLLIGSLPWVSLPQPIWWIPTCEHRETFRSAHFHRAESRDGPGDDRLRWGRVARQGRRSKAAVGGLSILPPLDRVACPMPLQNARTRGIRLGFMGKRVAEQGPADAGRLVMAAGPGLGQFSYCPEIDRRPEAGLVSPTGKLTFPSPARFHRAERARPRVPPPGVVSRQ